MPNDRDAPRLRFDHNSSDFSGKRSTGFSSGGYPERKGQDSLELSTFSLDSVVASVS